jgi:hypothetical protein
MIVFQDKLKVKIKIHSVQIITHAILGPCRVKVLVNGYYYYYYWGGSSSCCCCFPFHKLSRLQHKYLVNPRYVSFPIALPPPHMYAPNVTILCSIYRSLSQAVVNNAKICYLWFGRYCSLNLLKIRNYFLVAVPFVISSYLLRSFEVSVVHNQKNCLIFSSRIYV